MKYDDKNIDCLTELIKHLKQDVDGINLPIWFRGQANSSWNLEPKLMRTNSEAPENYYINRFKQDASIILDHQPNSEFEWLFLMQHYGFPTRLLDWSESPLVALYFAIENTSTDGALYVLLPTELNKICNYRPAFESEIPSFEDEHLKNYFPSTIASETKSILPPIAAIAPRNSTRMQAQQGVFTISHRENIFINVAGREANSNNHIWKYIIPKEAKESLKKDLRLLGFSKFQLFPELASIIENI